MNEGDKNARKELFKLATKSYCTMINDSSCEVQLFFNEAEYIQRLEKIKKEKYEEKIPIESTHNSPGLTPWGDHFSPNEIRLDMKNFLQKQDLIIHVNASVSVIALATNNDWQIVVSYTSNKTLYDEALENQQIYGPSGTKTLLIVDEPFINWEHLLESEKEKRKVLFEYAKELYFSSNELGCKIQLLFDQVGAANVVNAMSIKIHDAQITFFLARLNLRKYLENHCLVNDVDAINPDKPGREDWKIVLVYSGDKQLKNEVNEYYSQYGISGSKTLSLANEPFVNVNASHIKFPITFINSNEDQKFNDITETSNFSFK